MSERAAKGKLSGSSSWRSLEKGTTTLSLMIYIDGILYYAGFVVDVCVDALMCAVLQFAQFAQF